MTNALLHKTAHDRFKHLKLIYRRLLMELNEHDLTSFFITANHLHDAVRWDKTVTQEQKDRVEKYRVGLDAKLANAVANNEKHGPQNQHGGGYITEIVQAVHLVNPWSSLRPEEGLPAGKGWQDGKEFIIKCSDGAEHHALGVVYRTFNFWEWVFEGPKPVKTGSVPLGVFIQQELERVSEGQEV